MTKLNSDIVMGLANLHDVFLQASLMKHCMAGSPIVKDPEQYTVSDRGRFERIWISFLYVLVETWNSSQMKPVREFVRTVVDTSPLDSFLRDMRKSKSMDQMANIRAYVCHRDERKYWDIGRLTPLGNLEKYLKLHVLFSHVLLVAIQSMNRRGRPTKQETVEKVF